MNTNEISNYREEVAQQLKEKESEIETSLSYITVGALGFFLTINEKFLKLQDCQLKNLLILSVFLLIVAFILILVKKSLTTRYDRKLLHFLDEMKPENRQEELELYDIWEKHDKTLRNIKTSTYFALGTGIILQVLFFMLNVLP
jgi:hypothetical protein